MLTKALILGVTGGALAWMWSPRVRKSAEWRATVTPLASIIGSGFLIAGPLIAVIVGKAAPFVMLAIVVGVRQHICTKRKKSATFKKRTGRCPRPSRARVAGEQR